MPVRDGERFLAEAIDSILGQTLTDFELIVVDDGSADRSAEIANTVQERDGRVRVHSQARLGLCAGLNAAAGLAAAPLLARLDADDIALPDRLERQVAFLDRHPGVAVVGGGVIMVDEAGRELDREPGREDPDLSEGNPLWHSTVVIRAEAFREAGGYRLYPAEDYDLWLRIEERYRLAAVPQLVVGYRIHAGQVSFRRLEQQAATTLAVRAAAEARRRGMPDPLAGVERVDARVLARLGIGSGAIETAVVGAALAWGASMARAGRTGDADNLLREVAGRPGAPSLRSLRRSVELALAKRAAYRRRPGEAVWRSLRAGWITATDRSFGQPSGPGPP